MALSEVAYLSLLQNGGLLDRVKKAYTHLSKCDICPLSCSADRLHGKTGTCKTGKFARISSFGAHYGEEDPIRGFRGSGTIFFSCCNLHCQYCQNFEISQFHSGKEVLPEDLATIMLELQSSGCHNINLVSPTHVIPQILESVYIAAQKGLSLPLVYNSGGYDRVEILRLLDGVIDIYMPDMKYADARNGLKYSKIPDYPAINQLAVKEMYNQVGDLITDENGIASRGLLIRHLILPNNIAGTDLIVKFITNQISKNSYLNLMDQYRPTYNAYKFSEINRSITKEEYTNALQLARTAGLNILDQKKSLYRWL